MKRIFPFCALWLVAGSGVVWAQPPTGNAPKAANPTNLGGARADMTPAEREAADQRALARRGDLQRILSARDAMTPEQDREKVRLEQEPLLRQSFNQAGFRDLKLQDAVVEFVAEQEKSRLPVREAAAKVYLALRSKMVAGEESIAPLLADLQSAVEVAKTGREAATQVLDAEVHFSTNPRLEALLALNGLVGDASWLTSDVFELGIQSAGGVVPYLPPNRARVAKPDANAAPQTPAQKAAADKAYLEAFHAGGDMARAMMKMTPVQLRESQLKTQEVLLRRTFAADKFQNPQLPDAVVALVAAQEKSREGVRARAAKIYLALTTRAAPTDVAAMNALLGDYLKAVETARNQREIATQALDRQISLTTNARLRALLTMKGLIGDASWFTGYVLPTGSLSLEALNVAL